MQLRSSAVSIPAGAAPNEDHWLAGRRWALVLDGITRYPDDGCVHDLPWYVRTLGAQIALRIEDRAIDLRAVLGEAIASTAQRHLASCDLGNPVTPGATVALVRLAGRRFEWLVLGDAAVAWRTSGGIEAVCDDRLARLENPAPAVDVGGIRRFPVSYIAEVRNRPDGFWVAAADPGAADAALTGHVEASAIEDALLCTDGITRLVDRYGHAWQELFAVAFGDGVAALAALVRDNEDRDAEPRSKPHDDATAVSLLPEGPHS